MIDLRFLCEAGDVNYCVLPVRAGQITDFRGQCCIVELAPPHWRQSIVLLGGQSARPQSSTPAFRKVHGTPRGWDGTKKRNQEENGRSSPGRARLQWLDKFLSFLSLSLNSTHFRVAGKLPASLRASQHEAEVVLMIPKERCGFLDPLCQGSGAPSKKAIGRRQQIQGLPTRVIPMEEREFPCDLPSPCHWNYAK